MGDSLKELKERVAKEKFHKKLLASLKDALDLPPMCRDTDILRTIKQQQKENFRKILKASR